MSVPYAGSTSTSARDETTKLLQRFGCTSVGWMEDFEDKSVLLAFVWRGRQVQLRAYAKGWAAMYLKENPWTRRRRDDRHDYEEKALQQGMIAVPCMLRDWIKGQVTAIESGVLSFGHVFMPYMLTDDGRPVSEVLEEKGLLKLTDETEARP